MLIVQDGKVVTFFCNFNRHSDDSLYFFLVLSFSSLITARILWSIFINFENVIVCYLFLMIVSHTVVFKVSSHSFVGISDFEMLILKC